MEANVTNKMEENARVTRRQRFVRLANKRVVKAIEAIQLLGNLSSPAYQYDENDVTKIFEAIRPRLSARSKFSNREKRGVVFCWNEATLGRSGRKQSSLFSFDCCVNHSGVRPLSLAGRGPRVNEKGGWDVQHTESCRRQLFPSKEIERWIELGNLVLHLSGCCRVAGRGPTMQQRVAYLGQ